MLDWRRNARLAPARGGAPTARSYILITPDGEIVYANETYTRMLGIDRTPWVIDCLLIPPEAVGVAPGRVELLGNHTDYTEGFVLTAAIVDHAEAPPPAMDIPRGAKGVSVACWRTVAARYLVPSNRATSIFVATEAA